MFWTVVSVDVGRSGNNVVQSVLLSKDEEWPLRKQEMAVLVWVPNTSRGVV